MATSIQGLDMVFEVRTPADASTDPDTAAGPWLELVCALDDQSELDNEVSVTDTKCGPFSGVKKPTGSYSGNAVASKSLSGTQASARMVQGWQDETTLLDFRYYNKDTGADSVNGDVISQQGQGYFTNSVVTGTNGEVVQFSWSFSPNGAIIINEAIV